jgi:hypothetical protein
MATSSSWRWARPPSAPTAPPTSPSSTRPRPRSAATSSARPIIVDKSTVPVGTAERIARIVGEQTKQPFVVVSNPEFLKEGAAVDDFMHPDRIIIGTTDEAARQTLHRLYQPFCRTNDRMIFMDARSAELTKYACNAYLAARISFMNDMANLADSVGADIELVRRGMGSDPRIGPKFLFPGVGYGGSCFPKDIRALLTTAREYGHTLEIVASAERINEAQKLVLVRKLRKHFDNDVAGKTFGVWGLAFKPNTDDIREAPALKIIRTLVADGAKIKMHDPEAGPNFLAALGENSPRRLHPRRGPLRGRRGRPRPAPRHRVARVPEPRLRAPQGGSWPAPLAVRRPQPVGPRPGRGPRLLLHRHRPLTRPVTASNFPVTAPSTIERTARFEHAARRASRRLLGLDRARVELEAELHHHRRAVVLRYVAAAAASRRQSLSFLLSAPSGELGVDREGLVALRVHLDRHRDVARAAARRLWRRFFSAATHSSKAP